MNYETELERLVQFYENLSVASLAQLPAIYARDAQLQGSVQRGARHRADHGDFPPHVRAGR